MATIYDLLEVTSLAANTTYSKANGGLVGVVDGAVSTDLDDGEFDEGDLITFGGTTYTVSYIQEPGSAGTFQLGDGSSTGFGPGSESNLDVMFLTLTSGAVTRYFVLPNDSYGDFNVQAINTGTLQHVAGNDAAVIGTTNNAVQVVCLCAGTKIGVAGGKVRPVEELEPGDQVRTRDNGLQEIRWVGVQRFGPLDLIRNPEVRPVRIPASGLGQARPGRDLLVSRQHRILVRSRIAKRMFAESEVLVPAVNLLRYDGIALCDRIAAVSFHHLLLDRHEIILANGAWVESLFLGGEVRKTRTGGVPGPDLRLAAPETEATIARPLVRGNAAKQLVARHSKNARRLFE
ncbi:Hint domain-containing protein [Tropicibacter sp. S64]|uniref:Hint domain-containing protein n=1 Tax=Tropicibacter sp. S64 TaxID=3415122 RepID=UPI003C7A2508